MKEHFGAAIKVISPSFCKSILGLLFERISSCFERAFWGCCLSDQSVFLKEHFGAIVKVINPGFERAFWGCFLSNQSMFLKEHFGDAVRMISPGF